MIKFLLIVLLLWLVLPSKVLAVDNNFVTLINPVRGAEFWDQPSQSPETAVIGEAQILKENDLAATWLLRFDALTDDKIINSLPKTDEKGLFFEITPSLAKEANITYHKSDVWHQAGSVFLTGYSQSDRTKLIDTAFDQFKKRFGVYPQSVGAWWIDSYSLSYMQKKYGVTASLEVADQYTTDNYQIWGQYWSTPYYPSVRNALNPAQTVDTKIPLVVMQWAARDPVNGYSNGVNESTFSVQPNDYLDYHRLDVNYFGKLIDLYTNQSLNQFNQVVVGLENSYSWEKYSNEYQSQIKLLKQKADAGQFQTTTMSGFAKWYLGQFPDLSPAQIIVSDDPLGTAKKSVWFMNNYYRVGWFLTDQGPTIRDLRQYLTNEEICYQSPCDKLNFATFATRVLDEVTYKDKWLIDEGEITQFKASSKDDQYSINYINEAGKPRQLIFLPRDIQIDQQKSTIDGAIAKATLANHPFKNYQPQVSPTKAKALRTSIGDLTLELVKFIIFIVLVLIIPVYIFEGNVFLSLVGGITAFTLLSNFLPLILIIPIYLLVNGLFFYQKRLKISLNFKVNWLLLLLILIGTIFQSLTVIRSGWVYDFGVGFWGPTGHDLVWHQALVNQLILKAPPENPILSNQPLVNYHYYYDLLVAQTYNLTKIPPIDLIYRFYPIFFSILLGVGSYQIGLKLFTKKIAAYFSVYMVYFAGSLGWLVEYLKNRSLGGESAFWANQSISFNLNPPFAISVILLLGLVIALLEKRRLLVVLLAGTLIEFKSYAGLLVLASLFLSNFWLFIPSALIAAALFLPQNLHAGRLLIISPFWFIHTMIDFTDRVGWVKLSQARQAYLIRKDWIKFILAEGLGLALFIVGNFATRMLALFVRIPKFIFLIIVFSLALPLIFIQAGNNWNTIQFLYYGLLLTSIMTGQVLFLIYQKLPKVINILAIIILLFVGSINSFVTFKDYLGKIPPTALSLDELEALNSLKSLPPGVVLTYPYRVENQGKIKEPVPLFAYVSNAYVSAFSGHLSFVEDYQQQQILQTDYHRRIVGSDNLFETTDLKWSKKYLQDNNIKYIYLPKLINLDLPKELGIEKIFQNDGTVVYQVM